MPDQVLHPNATGCALHILRNKWDHHKSLNGEDILLMATLVGATQGTRGTFVELGAYTGDHSNTAIMERCFGWSGLLIEGSLANFQQLKAKANRPRSVKVHSAVCGPNGIDGKRSVRFTRTGGPVSGHIDMFEEKHQRMWSHVNKPSQTVQVPCQPLERIMVANGLADGATFLSLDVEGSEEMVLSTVQPSAFRIIMVETTGYDPAKEERIRKRILSYGFHVEPVLTRQMSNSSHVYARHGVAAHPLPNNWYRNVPTFAGRVVFENNVTAGLLSRLLTHAAHRTEPEPELQKLLPLQGHNEAQAKWTEPAYLSYE